MKKILVYLLFAGVLACVSIGTYVNAASEKKADRKEQQELTIDVYPTYGPYGAIRKAEYHPGERLFFLYRITGLTAGPRRQLDAVAEFNLYNEKDGFLTHIDDFHFNGPLNFGGDVLCFEWANFGGVKADASLPMHTNPGEYRLEMVVQDHRTGKKVGQHLLFNVLPKGTFGAINLQLSADPDGQYPIGYHPSVGQTIYITCGITGHSVVDGRMKVQCSMIITRDGKPVDPVGEKYLIETEVDATRIANGGFTLMNCNRFLNRPGRFMIEFELEDLLAKDKPKASYKIPLVVVAPWEDMNVGENKKVVSQKTE